MLINTSFKTISKIFLAVFIVFVASNLKAQQYNTIYWMQGIPQHVYSNPAQQTDANWYIGMPGLSSIYAGYGNSGFGISDLLKKDASGAFYWDEAGFLEGLGSKNLINLDMQYEALAFGFRYKENNYFHFSFSEKVGLQFGFPQDLFNLALEGNNYFLENTDTGEANFSGFGINAIHYSEFGIGYSRILNDMFNVGGKIKVLFGHANAYLSPNDLRFHTDAETFALSLYTDVSVHTSLPMEIGPISITDDGEETEETNNEFVFDPMEYLVNFSNLGFAADLGVVYNYDEKVTFALSVVDLGYINWKSNTESYRLTGDAVYDGIDIGNLFALGGFVDVPADTLEQEDPVEAALENLEINYSQESYSLFLYPKIFLSAKYQINDMHSFSVLARGNFFENKLYPSFTLAYNIQPIKPVGFTLAYSVINNSFANIGFGMHLNLYPFQLYLVADNVFPALQPHTTQTATVHLGINWVFGYRQKKDPCKPFHGWSF